ncbi:MAG: hypothetical protein JWR59_411 [Brevundimonas sp.]|nr:hypothetical protein [Brevundimonas sp.]
MIAAAMLSLALASDVVVTNPAWITPPSHEMVAEPMPPFATAIGVDADVTLDCRVLPRPAAPQACQVVTSTATGLGFEDTAIELAATGLLQPRTVNGVPQAGRIRFTVQFRAEDLKSSNSQYTGPAPSELQLRLARQLLDSFGEWIDAGKYEAFSELEPVRRARVNLWMRELFPIDIAAERDKTATLLARLLSEAELKAAVATGRPPERRPSQAEFEKAMAGLNDWDEAAIGTLRARYCADYDCGRSVR